MLTPARLVCVAEGETTPTNVAAQSAEADIIPVLLGEGVNKKKYPLKCCVSQSSADVLAVAQFCSLSCSVSC